MDISHPVVPAGLRHETTAGGIAVLTIDRPERRNAIDKATAQAISDALDAVDADDAVRVAVITGAGGTFSAGMDLKALDATGERPIVEGRGQFGICRRPPEKPLIAAVEGAALGGGTEIALAADVIVAAEDAVFGLPEVKLGLAAAAGGAIRLPRRIPYGLAVEHVLTGRPLPAPRAHELGLVNHLTASGGALEVAMRIAKEIAGNAPLGVRLSKQVMLQAQDVSVEEAFRLQEPLMQVIRSSQDAAEGARAFVEKRPAVWQGR
ncbi:crotonase/enoyl-CoA hydratase family protein [Conexibacter sp. SYSU D00693]|uniref:crotonase/enoyl-CoA hydratase family protein n=1 Tax=Conexibacter sp. SYSU D00693 TaxID=2812560 RepID=UPI00196A57F7|nr:crotonase/enoyl-CoA hydratase family protein [Conexibacter sp. SYSU D00693]